MAESTNTGTNAIVNAINQSATNTISGFTAATEGIKSEVSKLSSGMESSIKELSTSIDDSKESEEDKTEEKRSRLKQLGVLGAIAGSLLVLPKMLAKTTMTAASKGKGLFGAVLGSELLENAVSLGKTVLAPVTAVAGAAAKVAAPILKKAGKFGLIAAGVFAAVEGVKGAFEGVSRAGEIFGVEQEQATMSQKISAGIGGFVEGIANAPATLLEMIGMGKLAEKWRTFIDQFNITETVAKSIEPTVAKIVKFFDFLGPVFQGLKPIVIAIKDAVEPILTTLFKFFTDTVGATFQRIKDVGIFQKIENLILTIGGIVGDVFTKINESGILPKIREFFLNVFVDGFGDLLESVTTALENAKPTINKIVGVLTAIISFLKPVLESLALDVIFPAIKGALGMLVKIFNFLGDGLAKIFGPLMEGEQSPEEQGKAFVSKIKNIFSGIAGLGDKFIEVFNSAMTKFSNAVSIVNKKIIDIVRKIPGMSKFRMTDEEREDFDRRKLIEKEIEGLASSGLSPFGESRQKQMADTQAIAGILERSSKEDIAALLMGDRLNENARQELAKLFNENKKLFEEVQQAKQNLNNFTNINADNSTKVSSNQYSAGKSNAGDPNLSLTQQQVGVH